MILLIHILLCSRDTISYYCIIPLCFRHRQLSVHSLLVIHSCTPHLVRLVRLKLLTLAIEEDTLLQKGDLAIKEATAGRIY
jgi:hypothetical protein